ncbi:hypothetical protein BDB13_4048 [Rhodococcus sp. OK302]|nr:hypothetical protein BDB13_4048 [Rhodococcus sp. OK302]
MEPRLSRRPANNTSACWACVSEGSSSPLTRSVRCSQCCRRQRDDGVALTAGDCRRHALRVAFPLDFSRQTRWRCNGNARNDPRNNYGNNRIRNRNQYGTDPRAAAPFLPNNRPAVTDVCRPDGLSRTSTPVSVPPAARRADGSREPTRLLSPRASPPQSVGRKFARAPRVVAPCGQA